MGINCLWLKDQPFARSIPRTMDRDTMLDILGILEYEAKRSNALEEIGINDTASSVDCLFDFLMDAMGVPPETSAFKRHDLEKLFYSDYLLDHQYATLEEALGALEALRDQTLARLQAAERRQQGFTVISGKQGGTPL